MDGKWKRWVGIAGIGLGSIFSIGAANRYQIEMERQMAAAVAKAETMAVSLAETEETEAETTAEPQETTEETEPAYIPEKEKLNLAYYFPEGEDETDVLNSYAGQLYEELSLRDSQWLAELYGLSQISPGEMASRLGKSSQKIGGITSWKRVNLLFQNGDGKGISGYSNVKEIMSLASLYHFSQMDSEDGVEKFYDCSRQLWEASHSYTMGMSDVYYCSGCLEESDETELKEAAEETEASQEETRPAETSPAETTPAETTESPETEASTYYRGYRQNRSAPPAAGIGLEYDASVSAADFASASDASEEAVAETETTAPETSKEPKEEIRCPGHVDLNISVKITGIEENHSLFELFPSDENWEGWTKENKSSAVNLSQKDWFTEYGLSVSTVISGKALTSEEISQYISTLPEDISEERKKVIEFALSSVGKVPYYWGGKPYRSGYEDNNFGTIVTADEEGRILRGLDCSGWINWVYWSALGERLPYESTSGLAACGSAIKRSELKPGDIVLKTGEDAHVVMFLGWMPDGQMQCIHESSSSVNNVTVDVMQANWPYYRNLLDD